MSQEPTTPTKTYPVTVDQLKELNELNTDNKILVERLEKLGGLEELAGKLETDLTNGLTGKDDAERTAFFGSNLIPEIPPKSIFYFLWKAFKEPIMILLAVFAVISIIVNAVLPPPGEEKTAWVEGFAIMIAVIIVVCVGGLNDFQKDRKFRALNKVKNDKKIKVIRNGKVEETSIFTVQVGELIQLVQGDQIPADGIFISGNGTKVDEAAMTGESRVIRKEKATPFMVSGTAVSEGNCVMMVTAVGWNSAWGILYKDLQKPPEDTPLQESLEDLAKLVGYIGMIVAGLLLVIQIIRFIVRAAIASKNGTWDNKNLTDLIGFFIESITLVVVAVPEGLPLAVTISLAYSMQAMLKDNNLVRHLAACETMGGATNICSDKTGTLTENRMKATRAWFAGKKYENDLASEISASTSREVTELWSTGVSINSTASLEEIEKEGKTFFKFIGNTTEGALLVLAKRLGFDYAPIRAKGKKLIAIQYPFSSSRKRMGTVVTSDNGYRMHVKGASEIILERCSSYIDGSGKPINFTNEKAELLETITSFAKLGLRTLGIAYKDLPEGTELKEDADLDNDLVLIAIIGIEDPVREEVPPAIQQCKRAGITVRMVTGDNALTATKISKDCGILESEDTVVMEGPDFRKLTDEELDKVIPRLRVLARSAPQDKLRLVKRLKHFREVVAVTGDGTNDAPALKAADVGMAMGITGTEIAKEAAAIIIMDDNFASIVKAVMWGRNVRASIQKFIQFQLTINMVALTIAFISALIERGEPLKPIQLLWVNLIQDSLAALALATDKPTEAMLDEKPAGRTERLITPIMWRNMLIMSAYQIMVLFLIFFIGDKMFGIVEAPGTNLESFRSIRYTMVFNTFVFMQLFNEINARKIKKEWNIFEGFFGNWIFVTVLVVTTILQVIFVQVGGAALGTVPLDGYQWLFSFGLAVTVLPVGIITRLIVPAPEWDWLKYNKSALEAQETQEEENEKNIELQVQNDKEEKKD